MARELEHRESLGRMRPGCRVVEAAEVYTLDSWLERMWEASRPECVLLPAAAERVVWEQIIDDDARANPGALPAGMADLLDRSNLARLAADAWRRIHDYARPPAALTDLTVETAAFARWSKQFATCLDENLWASRPQLTAEVTAAIANGGLELPKEIVFRGFERSWPALDRLVDCLRTSGATVSADWEADEARPGVPTRVQVYATPLEEVRAVARQIREALQADTRLRVGVVAADLSALRPLFDRVLSEELHPAWVLLDEIDSPRRFDLAGAPALSDYSLVAHALDLLALTRHANEFPLVSRVLLAPYPRISEADAQGDDTYERELEGRAHAEARSRDRGSMRAGLGQIASLLKRSGAPLSASRFDELDGLLDDDDVASPRVWTERFTRRLRAMGWPGQDLREIERVVFARWRELLDEFSSLATVLPVLTQSQALARISELAGDKLVQAPSAGLRVQVMGALDAAGLCFDRIYLVGFDARTFPAPAFPHPLLPVGWQVEHAHPRASAGAELAFSERLWRGLLASAPEVFASFARQGEGDEPRQPSPFLFAPAEAEEPIQQPSDYQPWYRQLTEERTEYLVAREPDLAPAALVLSGGTGLLADQSACPFRALAARRLRAKPLDVPVPGPQADVLGTMVHAALAETWLRLGDSRRLRALDEGAGRDLATSVAQQVVEDRDYAVDKGMREATSRWLADLVFAWLRYEAATREGEWRVIAREIKTSIEFDAGVELAGIRVDRVDELEDGRLVVLDYKTANTASSATRWFGQRPADPQLPVYALALGTNGSDDGSVEAGREVAAIGFANLAARNKLSLKGPPECEVLPPSSKPKTKDESWPGWRGQLARWQEILSDLAYAYAEGRADVDPLPGACKYCRREALCRVFEGRVIDAAEEPEQ